MLVVFFLGVLIGVPILLLSMVITNRLEGGRVGFGDVRGVLLRAVPLLAIVHALSMTWTGRALAGVVWWIGLKFAFDLEPHQVRILVRVNWLVNVAVNLALVFLLP